MSKDDANHTIINQAKKPVSFIDFFNKHFPYYLSIGMNEHQFWDCDCKLAEFYRKAEEIRRERMNQEAWLQGMYIYDTLLRVSPVLRAFGKKGSKPQAYLEEPYPITEKDIENKKEKQIKREKERHKIYLENFMVGHNKKFEERK